MRTIRRYTHGDRMWAVEWTESVPLDENGDADIDNAVEKRVLCATKEQAVERAIKESHADCHQVSVSQVEYEAYDETINPRYGYWIHCDDGEYYEGGEKLP